MNYNEFSKYLRGQYRPDPAPDQDEMGGYLIPNIIMVNKVGLLAKIYRWAGWSLRSTRLYKKGTYDFDFKGNLLKYLKEKS